MRTAITATTQQTCITKRIRTEGLYGKTVTKRVRICQ
jgi:hypothetical protein